MALELRGRTGAILSFVLLLPMLAYDVGASAASVKLAALLLALLPLLLFVRQRTPSPLPRSLLLWFALLGWALLAALRGGWVGVAQLAGWFACGAVALLWRRLADDQRRRGALLLGAAAGLVLGVFVCLQALLGARGMALHGLQGNPNWLGLVLALCLPLGAALPMPRWARPLIHGPPLLGLLLAGSRVALVAVVVASLPLVFSQRSKRRLLLLLVALLSLTGLILASQALSPQSGLRRAAAGRLHIWRASLVAARQSLPWGAGLGRFEGAFLPAQGELLAAAPDKRASTGFENAKSAHNDWLHTFVELGPMGVLLLFLVAVAVWRELLRDDWALRGAGLAALICSSADVLLLQPAALVLVGVLLGCCERRAPVEARSKPSRELAVSLLLLVCSGVLGAEMARHWLGERAVSQAIATPETTLLGLRRAHALSPRCKRVTVAWALGEARAGATERAEAALRVARAQTMDLSLWVASATVAFQRGELEQAERHLRAALALHPRSFAANLNLAEVLRRRGKLAEAERRAALAAQRYPFHAKVRSLRERLREDRSTSR